MADLLPGFVPPADLRPRQWHTYDNYRVVHDKQMELLEARGVVLSHDVAFYEDFSSVTGELERVHLDGRIELSSGAKVRVDKWLAVQRDRIGRLEVVADVYAYHAWIVGSDGSELPLFRYDNADDDDLASLHRHRFYDDGTPRELTEPVPAEQMPYLNEVIEEADRLAWNHPLRVAD